MLARVSIKPRALYLGVRALSSSAPTTDSTPNRGMIFGLGALGTAALYTYVKGKAEPVIHREQSLEKTSTLEKPKVTENLSKTPATTATTAAPPAQTTVSEPTRAQIPPLLKVPYVLVGAGTASFFAMRGITEADPNAKVLIIGDEAEVPYMRTPLSKELWFKNLDNEGDADYFAFQDWGGKNRSIFYEPREFYCTADQLLDKSGGAVALLTGSRVVDLNVHRKRLQLSNGRVVEYDKLLLATGGIPKQSTVLDDAPEGVKEHVHYYRKTSDFQRLNELIKKSKSLAVIGGGFLGSELAVALAHRGKKNSLEVTQIYRERGNMAKVLPEYLSKWSTERVEEEGVRTVPGTIIVGAVCTDEGEHLMSLYHSFISILINICLDLAHM